MPDVPLRQFIEQWQHGHEQIHDEQRRALDAAFEAAAEKSARHNDLIHAMDRQSATFLSRLEYDTHHEALEQRVHQLEAWRSRVAGVGAVLILLAGALGAFIVRAVG